MREWPDSHPNIVTYRYEQIVGSESDVLEEILGFYGLSVLERALGRLFARRYSLRKLATDSHVRNPAAGQWREHFTPRVKEAFDERYADLLQQLGYAAE